MLSDEEEQEKILEEIGEEKEKNSGISDLKEYDPNNPVKEEYHACLLSKPMMPSQRDDKFKEEVVRIQTFVQRLVVWEGSSHNTYNISVNRVKQH